MSIFRKDKPEKPEELIDDLPQEEEQEFTDISEAAYGSSSKSQDSRMEEIYSTKDKQVKFKRRQPLEEEAAAKRMEAAKEELIRGKLEFSSAEEEAPAVRLEAELDPDAVVSDEIIEDVVNVKKLRNIYVEDVKDIDVSLDPARDVNGGGSAGAAESTRDTASAMPHIDKARGRGFAHSGDTVVAKVPIYQHESKTDNIYIKAGRFTDVVESEYDEYLKSTDPNISKNYHAKKQMVRPHQSLLYTLSQAAERHRVESEQKQKSKDILKNNFDEEQKKPKKKKHRSHTGRFFRTMGAVISSSVSSPSREEVQRSQDYNSREDEKYFLERTNESIKQLLISFVLYLVLTVVLVALVLWERTSGAAAVAEKGGSAAFTYCAVNLILTVALGLVARHKVIDGLKPLKHIKATVNTVPALAYLACLLQSLVSLFTSGSFAGADHHLYSFIAAFGFLLNTAGRLVMTVRVKRNFEFISSRSPAYAAKLYTDQENTRRMVSGTTVSKGAIAYQHVTSFLTDFLKISYAPDPSEEMAGRVAPITLIVSVFVTVLYAILFKSVQGTVSAMAAMLCIGIPFTAMLTGNLPMLMFSRRMLEEDAMVAGYPTVRQFSEASAVMMSASDLFPTGCIRLEQILPLQQYRLQESLLSAAAVLREGNSPIASVFDELIIENGGSLPRVESVMYEDKSGLVGWIGGDRVLIGNLTLMNRYHITVPDSPQARKMTKSGKEITYIAVSGQAVAILALNYSAAPIAREQIKKAEQSGLAIIVSTTDPNVTAELIADRYELFFRSVKVTAPGYSDIIDDLTSKTEQTSRAYLATRGRIGSLACAIGGCIGLKANIRLGIVIELFGTVLGLLLCATLALCASVARLTEVELIIYILFWTVSTIVAEVIRRP